MAFTASRRGFDVIPDPPIRTIRKQLRAADKALPKELGRTHKRLGEIPANEAKQQARSKGGGYTRLARDIRTRSNQNDVRLIIGGRRFPDSVGWEFGALRWPQFDTWTGRGDNAGYVVFALKRDQAFMDRFQRRYVEEMSKFLDPIISISQ